MNWNQLKSIDQLEQLIEESNNNTVLIFKHSTRCPVSSMALNRLERSWDEAEMNEIKPYYLDLISFRDISNKIANQFQVEHQSPQILIIKNESCVYHDSHLGINYHSIKDQAIA